MNDKATKLATELVPGDVLIGFPAGPMIIRRVTNGSRAGEPRINIWFVSHSQMIVLPDRRFNVAKADS